MKTLKFTMLIVALFSFFTASAQYKNLDKLPEKQRDSILLEVAKETLFKYTEGYYKEGIIPIIKDLGLNKADRKYFEKFNGIKIYSVSYPFLEEEKKNYYKGEDYAVTIKIRADTGKPIYIWFAHGVGLGDLDEDTNKKTDFKMRNIPLEEMKKGGMRSIKNTIDLSTREAVLKHLKGEELQRVLKSMDKQDSLKEYIRKRKESQAIRRKIIDDSLRNSGK